MAAHRSKNEEPVEFSGVIIHETQKALLLGLDPSGVEQWFPHSVIISREDSGMSATIEVAQWFAYKEKLI